MTTCPKRRLGVPVIVFLLLIQAGCALQVPRVKPVALPDRFIPQDRLLDLQIAAFLGSGADRRAMQKAEDPLLWLDEFWLENDPSPGTPENEALLVYRQRATWLQSRFPGTSFGELPTLWSTFLRFGLPDMVGNKPLLDSGFQTRGRSGTTVAGRSLFHNYTRLRYGSPRPFMLVIEEESGPAVAIDRTPPRRHPTLEEAWSDLEDPTATVWHKQRALIHLSWYELSGIVERLLTIPVHLLAGCEEQFDDALIRLGVRSCYLLQADEIRRVAVLRSAHADPRMVVQRILTGHYTPDELRQDLEQSEGISTAGTKLERTPNRGPHMELRQDPEKLIAEILQAYPSETRLTGWDWRGDAVLCFGPPAWTEKDDRIMYFTWGTPEVIQVGESMLGMALGDRIEDTLMNFLGLASEEVNTRQMKGLAAGTTLSLALRSDTDDQRQSSRTRILEQLHVLAPPHVYQIGLPLNSRQLPITMDAVAFPAGIDSIEIQASIGIPTSAVQIHQTAEGYTTDLRTSLVVFDHTLNVVYSEVRSLGYLIEGTAEIEDRFLLDTFRFTTSPGSYIAYLSAEDPVAGTSGGSIQNLDFNWHSSPGLQVSPIMLASSVEFAPGEGKFHRGEYYILPAPGRYLFAGSDLHIYFEISNLAPSEFGDHVWSESYYVIPDSPDAGIVTIGEDRDYTRLAPLASRSMQIDLSGLEAVYEGPIFVVVLVTDKTSGEQAIGVTRFNIRRRSPPQ
ncbi:hypothetical protein ACFL6T_05595 [Candidatus Zixiibacteriota bacterium]